MNNFNHVSGEYLKSNGAKIYYEVTGSKDLPALLVLHGGFGNMENMNGIINGLNKTYRVIGIDSRGHGKSTINSKGLSYELIQKDVEQVLEHLRIDNLNVIGFSDGGVVAYRLATFTTLKINKLITIGSRWHVSNILPLKELFMKVTGESWKNKFPSTFKSYQQQNPEPDFDFLAQSLVRQWLDTENSGYPNEAIKNISCPLLIIRGDEDHLVSREAVFEAASWVKGSKLLNIPYAGHVVHEEQKEICTIIINEFLNETT